MKNFKDSIILAITGASGVQYGFSLIQALVKANYLIYLLISDAAKEVIKVETNLKLPNSNHNLENFFIEFSKASFGQINLCEKYDWLTAPASGSSKIRQMIIAPCSMGTLSSIACGLSNNLIERAADVILKERQKLIIMPRETPLSTIHLKNMLTLSEIGAIIVPACPGFYNHHQTVQDLIEFMTAKILNLLDIEQNLLPSWGTEPKNIL